MGKLRWFVLLAVLVLFCPAVAAQAPWIDPPPTEPDGFTRQLEWTFNSSDWQTPITWIGPTWDTGEYTCDEIRIPEGLTVTWIEGTGIKLENLSETPLGLVFHVNNWDRCRPWKWVWVEADWSDDSGNTVLDLVVPYEFEITIWQRVENHWYGEIYPNPIYEEFIWTVAPGGSCRIWDFRVHTVCVPEPSGLAGLLIGVGLLARRRK